MSKPLVTRRESERYPGLFVKKYTRRVFYDNLWTPELLESRGHVEDREGNIVVRPFTKIFNRFENGTDIDRDEQVVAIRKVNGFMACATYVPQVGKVVVSTSGSLDSDFVKMAEEYITEEKKERIRNRTHGYTYMFEVCHPNDKHIIVEKPGAYLIGIRHISSTSPYWSYRRLEEILDNVAMELGVDRPTWIECPFYQVVSASKQCTHEGYVVYGQESNTALKIKSPLYLTAKFVSRMRDEKFSKWLDEGTIKEKVEEEFYPLVDHLVKIKSDFIGKTEQEKLVIVREFLKG